MPLTFTREMGGWRFTILIVLADDAALSEKALLALVTQRWERLRALASAESAELADLLAHAAPHGVLMIGETTKVYFAVATRPAFAPLQAQRDTLTRALAQVLDDVPGLAPPAAYFVLATRPGAPNARLPHEGQR